MSKKPVGGEELAKRGTVSDFAAHKGEILEIWDEMQNLQCDFCVGLELPAYFRSKLWGAAKTVVDLGTGNGRYLAYLARYFPEKRYFGFDLVPELIENAKARIKLNNVTFLQEDLFDLDGLYDARRTSARDPTPSRCGSVARERLQDRETGRSDLHS